MPSIYNDITAVPGEFPVSIIIPADTGRLKAVAARPESFHSGVNESYIQLLLADATTDPPTPKAVLVSSAIGATQYIGWDGDIQLEAKDVIFVRIWSLKAGPFRIFVTTEV